MFVRLASRYILSECVITYASKRIENLTRVVKGPSIGRLVTRRLLGDYVAYTSHIQRCMHRCEADETRHDGTIYCHQARWIPASTRTTCFTLPAPDRFARGLRFYRFFLSRLLVTHLQFYQGLSRRIYLVTKWSRARIRKDVSFEVKFSFTLTSNTQYKSWLQYLRTSYSNTRLPTSVSSGQKNADPQSSHPSPPPLLI